MGEEWVDEDVLCALTELEYLHRHAAEVEQRPLMLGEAPTNLVLPTDFLGDLDVFCANNTRLKGFPACTRLQTRLSETHISSISLAKYTQGHFTALTHRIGSRHFEFGDSMHHTCDPELGIRVQMALSTTALPLPEIVEEGEINLQGVNGGEGSCGMAMLNYIQRSLYPQMEKWSCAKSALFRTLALCDLIHYHILSLALPGRAEDWMEPASEGLRRILQHDESCWAENSQLHVVQKKYDGSAFHDYNLYKPLVCLIRFLNRCNRELINFKCSLFILFSISTRCGHSKLNRSLPSLAPLLGVFSHTATITAPKKMPSKLKTSGDKRPRSVSISHSPTVMRPKKRRGPKREPSPEVEIMSIGPLNCLKVEQSDSEIELLSPPCTPPPPHPSLPKVKIEAEVIDLTTPQALGKKPIKMEPIDIRSPAHSKGVKLEDIKPQISGSSSKGDVIPAPPPPALDRLYDSCQDAQTALYVFEQGRGHIWCKGQSLNYPDSGLKKLTFRCKCYRKANPTHNKSLDPSQHREGKSAKTDCPAHVNVNYNKTLGSWRMTTCNLDHNHPPALPTGAKPRVPASTKQKDIICNLATNHHQSFTRSQVAEVLLLSAPDEQELEPRKIGALITRHRAEARNAIKSQGGDCAVIAKDLRAKHAEDPRWRYEISISPDGSGVVDGVFWQSPLQVELSDRYGDVLVFDSSYKQNDVEYPLSIRIVIDGFCASCNVFYAVTATEGSDQVKWIFQCYLRSTKCPPTTFISDRHATLLSIIPIVLPLTNHLYCLHHLLTNIDQNLRRKLGGRWGEFMPAFRVVYRAVSPEIFTRLWETLVARFPEAADYLNNELWPCRERWAWTYTAYKFTVGIRTSGRVESENRVTKVFAGAKTSLFQLYCSLNERTNGQSVKEMRNVRDVRSFIHFLLLTPYADVPIQKAFRQKHPTQIESIFPGPLALLRMHAGPFALQTCFKQMELSLYYNVVPLQLPAGLRHWVSSGLSPTCTNHTNSFIARPNMLLQSHPNQASNGKVVGSRY